MTQYIIDSFTSKIFSGNPAAVLPLEEWLSDEILQKIAAENNLSETAFFVKQGGNYHLRWFTPTKEIDLCGHATLASAFVVMKCIEPHLKEICFKTLSGDLWVKKLSFKQKEFFEMSFPSFALKEVPITQIIKDALCGLRVLKAFLGRDLLCIIENEASLFEFMPRLETIIQLDGLLLHISTKGGEFREGELEFDCISRSFGPKCDILEDPVCGSGHCHIIPFWAKELGKNNIIAYQASKRGGVIYGSYHNNKVTMSGEAVLFAKSKIFL